MKFFLVGFLLTCSLALGQIRGPVSALVFDHASHSVRQILGVPGAAYYSGALAERLDLAAVSPDGRHVLATRDNQVIGIQVTDNGLIEQLLGEGTAVAMAWSRSSDTAVWATSDELYRWSIADGVTRLGAASNVKALALDATGLTAYAARSGVVEAISADSPARLLASIGEPTALAIYDASLYVTDAAEKRVLLIDTTAGGAQLFPTEASEPSAVAVSADGQILLVADAATKTVSAYRAASQERLSRIDLGFAPSELERIGDGLFTLKRRNAGEALEIVTMRQDLAAYFVPAPEVE
jgi:hypothetical protein